jgi:DNA topoisomerase IA
VRNTPTYVVDEKKRKVVRELQQQVLKADQVLLATDPDREGEAMAWHLADVLDLSPATSATSTTADGKSSKRTTTKVTTKKPYHRIRFTKRITKHQNLYSIQHI